MADTMTHPLPAAGSPTKLGDDDNNTKKRNENTTNEGDEIDTNPVVNFVQLYKEYCSEFKARVNSAVVNLLSEHPHRPLTKLMLGNNYVGPRGFEPILRIIAKCQTLEVIDLSGNGLTNDCMIRLSQVLSVHLGVQKLNLSSNAITLEGGKQLMSLLESNRRIIDLKVDNTDIFESLSKRLEMAADNNFRVTTGKEPNARPSKPLLSARPTAVQRPASSNPKPQVHLVPVSPARGQVVDTKAAAAASNNTVARPSTTGGAYSNTALNKGQTMASTQQLQERPASVGGHSSLTGGGKAGAGGATLSNLKPRPPNPAVASAQASRLSEPQREELRTKYKQRAETYRNVELATAKQAAAHVRKELAMLEAAEKLSEDRKKKSLAEAQDGLLQRQTKSPATSPQPKSALHAGHTQAKHVAISGEPSSSTSSPPRIGAQGSPPRAIPAPEQDPYYRASSTGNLSPPSGGLDDTQTMSPGKREHTTAELEIESATASTTDSTNHSIKEVVFPEAKLDVAHDAPQPTIMSASSVGALTQEHSQLVLGVEQQFQALFDLGSKYYGQRKLDEAHKAWTEAMAIAVEQKKREWMSIMHLNLQRLSYELLTTEGARLLAEGDLEEADRHFDLAADVACKARNAAWETEMQRAKRNVLHLKVQCCHDRATMLFENCCNHRYLKVDIDKDRYEQEDGVFYTHSVAFVNEWPRMLLLKEAVEEWAKGWMTTKRMSGSSSRVLQDLIQSSIGNVTAHLLTRYFVVEGSNFGTLSMLNVTTMSGYERRQLKRLWEELHSQATKLESLQWEVVSSAMIGHLELSIYNLSRAISKFEATILAAEELGDECLIAIGHLSKGIVYCQRSHYSESEKNLRVAESRWVRVRSKCIEHGHHANSPPGTSEWVSLSYAAHMHALTQSYLVEVVMGNNRQREALQLLEQQRLHQHIDMLREKLCANFTPSPSCHHITAVANSTGSPLVYYFQTYRHDWNITADEYESEERLYIWVVPGEGDIRCAVVDVTKSHKVGRIDDLVTELRQTLYIDTTSSTSGEAMLALPQCPWKQSLKKLYAILLDPVIAFLKIQAAYNELGTFTVVPSGSLWLVPFHALIDEEGDFLAQNFAVTHAFSATQLAFSALSALRVKERGLTKAVVMGDPTDSTANIVGGLPFTADPQRSAREVAVMEERLRAEVAPIADGQELKDCITHARLLHISAAVGGTDRKGTTFGGVCCETSYKQTGVIPSSDLSSYDFHAELVTMTQCNVVPSPTMDRTDGVLNVARSLLTSGNSCIVFSQWCTPDMTPSDFTVSYYQWATREPHKGKALARAIQQRMRKGERSGGELADLSPRHWAGYIVLGAPVLK